MVVGAVQRAAYGPVMSDHMESPNEVPIDAIVDPEDDPTASAQALDRLVARAAALECFMSQDDEAADFRLVLRLVR